MKYVRKRKIMQELSRSVYAHCIEDALDDVEKCDIAEISKPKRNFGNRQTRRKTLADLPIRRAMVTVNLGQRRFD